MALPLSSCEIPWCASASLPCGNLWRKIDKPGYSSRWIYLIHRGREYNAIPDQLTNSIQLCWHFERAPFERGIVYLSLYRRWHLFFHEVWNLGPFCASRTRSLRGTNPDSLQLPENHVPPEPGCVKLLSEGSVHSFFTLKLYLWVVFHRKKGLVDYPIDKSH